MKQILLSIVMLLGILAINQTTHAQTITVSGLTGSCAGANGTYNGPLFSLPVWGKTSGFDQYYIDKSGSNWVIRLDGSPGVTYATSPITNPNVPPCGPWTSVGSCTGTAVLNGGCQAASAACSITLTSGPLNQTVCVGVPITPLIFSTTQATNVSTGNMPPGVSAFFTGNATAGTITVSGTPSSIPSGYNPSLFVTAIGGTCTGINNVTFTINLLASPTISGPSTVNVGNTITLTGTGTPSGTPWSSNNGNATVNSSGMVTGVNGGTSVITYTASNGCSANKNITIVASPTASVLSSGTGPSTICVGGSANLKVNITGGTSPYTVVLTDGTTPFTTTGYVSNSNISVSPTSTKTYSIVSVTDANSNVGTGNTGTATITVNTPVITSLTANANPVCAGGNTVLSVLPGVTGVAPPYCNSSFTDITYEFITNVNYGGINNTSGGNTGGPVDYTSQIANVTAGSASTLSVTIVADANDFIYAWIDWNQNGVLNDAGEVYTLATGTSSVGPHTLSITPPVTALNGQTRMRVMVDWNNATPNPCRTATYGEAEDYTVNVTGGVTPTPSFVSVVWTPATYLNSTTLPTVTATGVTTNTTYTVQGTDAAGCTVTSSIAITVNPTPTGNTLANPIVIPGYPYTDTNNNLSANCWSSTATFTGNRTGNDVFYQFTLSDCNDSISATLCNTVNNWDTYLQLLDNTGTRIDFNDDDCGVRSTLNAGGLTTGGTYYLVVEGYDASEQDTFIINMAGYNGAVASNGLALSTTSSSMMQADGASLKYYDASCTLITTINDTTGGNVLGNTTSTVTVDPGASFHNGQPFARRWYQITPSSNGAAEVVLHFNQSDFNDLNAVTVAPYLMVPTTGSNADPNISNIRITKNDNAGLGNNPVVLTPTNVYWNGNYWEVTVNVPSFSQFRLHGANPNNAALSVGYKSFTVTKEATTDFVEWVTVNEDNNSHFNVQRSLDGNTFETLGRVNSKAVNGNSVRELNYSFVDETPQIGHNYYRLEQVDLDNKTSYTKTIDIIWGASGSVVSIYPNPTKGLLNIDLSTDKVSQTEIKLLDMSGRVVKSVWAQTTKGLNNLKVDMSELASGVYGIQIYENNILTYYNKVNKN